MSPLLNFEKVTWNYMAYYYLSLLLMLMYLLVCDRVIIRSPVRCQSGRD